TVGNMTTIDLNVTATDLRYTWVSPLYNGSAEVGDGMLNTLAFDFHLVVTVQDKTLTLPWYKVTVSGLSREITEVTFEGNRTISGPSIVMGAKYDHVIDDQWTRIGRFAWSSNVTVDGVQERMRFQVQGGTRLTVSRGGAIFQGFTVRAAFLYPAGQSIIHDPMMSAESFMPTIASGFNLTPFGILLIQVAVVGVALIPALYLRIRARRTPK